MILQARILLPSKFMTGRVRRRRRRSEEEGDEPM